MVISRRSELLRKIKDCLDENLCDELYYKEDHLSPKFKIKIELITENFFIDDQGNKWVRVSVDSKENKNGDN